MHRMMPSTASAIALSFSIGGVALADGHADKATVLDTYANIAQAMYEDSLTSAQAMKSAVDTFVAAPSEATHAAAKDTWLAARVPYQQTESIASATLSSTTGKVR